jgi:hypothetical protein
MPNSAVCGGIILACPIGRKPDIDRLENDSNRPTLRSQESIIPTLESLGVLVHHRTQADGAAILQK